MPNESKMAWSDRPGHEFHFMEVDDGLKSSDANSTHPTLDSDTEYNEKVEKARAEWGRRRKAGFDDYGTEMDKDAGVWKAYVLEADQVDKEMVQGWNKSLDVLLIFAALFSAILTAFVVVSSGDLEPDPDETSAQILSAILQTLQAASSGMAHNSTSIAAQEQTTFTPPRSSVVVNTLWYLSLSLSVAVSLLVMLAKEWSHSFMSNRSGQMYEQARRRQQRWDEIQRWKLIDVITLLPVLMHLALLLFAVGLSIRLWDIHVHVAVPVIATTAIAVVLYMFTYILPLIFEFCPYATASSKLVRLYVHDGLAYVHAIVRARLVPVTQGLRLFQPSTILPLGLIPRPRKMAKNQTGPHPLTCAGMSSTKDPTPMDAVTSRMLSWVITNCEEPKVIDRVIQSLSGAKPWLPRLPLLQSGARKHVLDRLNVLVGFDSTKRTYFLKEPASSDLALLYFRALFFLYSYHNHEGFYSDSAYQSELSQLQNTWKQDFGLDYSGFMVDKLFSSWGYGTNLKPLSKTADSIAYMNSFKLPSLRRTDSGPQVKYDIYECFQMAPDYIEQHITKQVVYHPATLLALIQSMTTQFSMPSRPWSECRTLGVRFPVLLVKLLCFLQSTSGDEDLYHAIAVGLTVCAFTFGNYPDRTRAHSGNPSARVSEVLAYHNTPRHLIHFRTGNNLSFRDSRNMETRSMLNFGLLALFDRPISHLIDMAIIETLTRVFQAVDQQDEFSYQYVHTLSPGFTFELHANHALTHFLYDHQTPSYAPSAKTSWFSFVSAMLQRLTSTPTMPRNRLDLESTYHVLVRHLCTSPSTELQQNLSNFLNSINIEVFTKELLVSLEEEAVLRMLLQASVSGNEYVAPTAMRLVWALVLQAFRSTQTPQKIQSTLRPLLENRPPGPLENIGHTGLTQIWLPHLWRMSSDCPRFVVDSQILDVMLNFYLPPFVASVESLGNLEKGLAIELQELQSICRKNVPSD